MIKLKKNILIDILCLMLVFMISRVSLNDRINKLNSSIETKA